jgi:hypothetical protein
MADTMISFADNSLSTSFLSKEELLEACPHAFRSEPTNPNVSDKYVQANTMTVIDDLAKLGWFPVQAKQCRAKKNSSGVRSFHMIALQNPNIKIMKTNADGTKVVDTYPRIIMTNSHDGYNSFKFMLGLFRLVCSNGLVVCDNQMVNMSIRHINYTFEELRRIVAQAIEEVPNIVNTMNKMRTIELSEEQKKNIARSMFKIRKNVEEDAQIEVSDEVLEDILSPVRPEDYRNDLWTVFNICQEKMIKGGFSASSNNNKTRKQRGITSIKKDIEFNQRLWGVASEYLAAA